MTGCDDQLYEVVVLYPFTWRLRAGSLEEAKEKAIREGAPGIEMSIGWPLEAKARLVEQVVSEVTR